MPRNFGFRISDFHPSTRRDTEACTLEERRPRHSRPSFHHWEESAYRPSWGEVRRNRRAAGASAGWKSGCDERSRSELTCFQPAVGDRQIAGCSAVNRWHRRITSATTSLRLCDFASLRFVSWVALRLCGSAPLRFFSQCSFSVSLCLCGSTGGRAGVEAGTGTGTVQSPWRASRRARKALRRWEMRFFSSSVISP